MIGDWNPFEETKAAPESVRIFGVELRVGDRVRSLSDQAGRHHGHGPGGQDRRHRSH